ncbi:hypothetical protein J5TS2_40300 [Brevibacillus halotolerans]|uniref:hypothetical protein n=1 Tax=Brevibacillus TaxID=55080 RepID=UPI000CE47042|nr:MULTISPECIES: hypothetical protein [Brevibacillus]PPA85966.1 hypothetical protein C4A76_15105 [Brevibacillus laterosporus]GIO03362.1 hypothetical protein J5TS2_40300 [Brevibacillus halotolerans]
MKKTRLVLWALDHKLNLLEVQDKLSKDYTQPIDDLLQYQVPLEERSLNHHWRVYDKDFRLSQIHNVQVEYILAQGILDYQNAPRKLWFDIEGRLMPKNGRVTRKEIDTIFFEMKGRVYAVLATPEYLEPKIRSNLFNMEHDWGRIDYRELPQFRFDYNFFNWLLSKKGKEINDSYGNSLLVIGVEGFSGETARGASFFTGTGGNIASQPVTKTMISMASSFNELEITLEYKDMRINFKMDYMSKCNFNDENSYKTSGSSKLINVYEAIISIYYEIIPLFNSVYHKEILDGTFRLEYDVFQKKAGLNVIEDIARQLDLSLKEISELQYFKDD